ncbi:Uridine nucleosidase 1 [Coemansia sp. RSA 552]|nr:Uridine nucleosidase 1 [Coemansia sp. RSA 552]
MTSDTGTVHPRTPVWLDCDVGHDDALALILAAYHPEIELLGVSSVSGNTPVKNTTANTIQVIQAAGIKGVKVYQGADKPLVKKRVHADNIHGGTGIDGTEQLPAPDFDAHFVSDTNAVNAMRQAIMGSEQPISIVATGPLTNVALLLSTYPEVVPRIKTLSIMGGAIGIGNFVPAAEFNIYCDPEAAHIVLNAGLSHVAFVPLEVTHTVLSSKAILDRIKATAPEPRFAQLVVDLLVFFSKMYEDVMGMKDGAPLHDPVAVAYLFMRNAFQEKHVRMDVECGSGKCAGRTCCDMYNVSGLPPNCWVTTAVDADRFWDHMMDALVCAGEKRAIAE